MGRHSFRGDSPQRTRRVSNRELRMAAKAEPPEAFGIRRRLAYDSQIPIIQTFRRLILDSEIPDTVIPRTSLHVTEMPKTKLDVQLRRGIVLGYEFGRKAASVQHDIREDYPNRLKVRLGAAAMFKQGNLGYRVESEELEQEYYGVREMIGRIGIKGTMRDVEPLHITCGDAKKHLTRFELFRALDVMNDVLADAGEELSCDDGLMVVRDAILEPVEFYPDTHAS